MAGFSFLLRAQLFSMQSRDCLPDLSSKVAGVDLTDLKEVEFWLEVTAKTGAGRAVCCSRAQRGLR